MNSFWAVLRLDLSESFRARWFLLYALTFGGVMAALLAFGLAESRVMGFTGLSRTLAIYIQLVMAILPVFILIATVRSVAGDREAGVFEYMLALPTPLAAWYWGRWLGRFLAAFSPVALALLFAVGYGVAFGADVPWRHILIDLALLASLVLCFLGLGFLISSAARSADAAQSVAFMAWLALLAFLDLILLGLLVRAQASEEIAVAIALLNPLQSFRTGSMLLFDKQLVLLGPSAWLILDRFGEIGYLVWATVYPAALGMAAAAAGYFVFRRGDLP